MYTAVGGYYNGYQIVPDEELRLKKGQRVIITLLEPVERTAARRKTDLSKYMGRGDKMFETDAAEYIKRLRTDERIP